MESIESIQQAVTGSNLKVLEEILQDHVEDFGFINQNGESLLHLAIEGGSSESVVQFLLEVPTINLAQRDAEGRTALDLCKAMKEGNMMIAKVFSYLLDGKRDKVEELLVGGWDVWPVKGIAELDDFQEAAEYLYAGTRVQDDVRDVHRLCIRGDQEEVMTALKDDRLVNTRDALGMTPLHKLVLMARHDLIQEVVEQHNADVHAFDNMKRTPLHYAAAMEKKECYEILKSVGADNFTKDLKGKTPDYYSNNCGALEVDKVRDLAALFLDLPNIEKKQQEIHQAIKEGDSDKLKELAADKRLMLMVDGSGLNPVHKCSVFGRDDMALHLVQHLEGAATALDNWHRTALHYSKATGNNQLNELLLKKGCDPTIKDNKGHDAEYYSENPKEINFDEMQENADYFSKLSSTMRHLQECHQAVEDGNKEKVADLIADERTVTAKDACGLTVLHKAVIYDNTEITQILLDKFPQSIDTKDHLGRTALHYAGSMPDKGLIYGILETSGANADMQDIMGKYPKDYKEHPSLLDLQVITQRLQDKRFPTLPPSRTGSSRPKSSRASTRSRTSRLTSARIGSGQKSRPCSSTTSNLDDSRTITREESDITLPVATSTTPDDDEDLVEEETTQYPERPDPKYCAKKVGTALAEGMALIGQLRPRDPVEFLAHYLYKHADNQKWTNQRNEDETKLQEERKKWINEMGKNGIRRAERMEQEDEDMRREREKMEEEERQRQEEELRVARSKLPHLDEAYTAVGKNKDGKTRLHLAVGLPDIKIRLLLEEESVPVWERDANGNTARDIAIKHRKKEYVKEIDDYVVQLFVGNQWDEIFEVVLNGYFQQIPDIEKVLEDEVTDEIGQVLDKLPEIQTNLVEVFDACARGNLKLLQQSLDRKSYVLSRDTSGRTPLHVAIVYQHEDLIKYLVNKYPEAVNATDNLMRTPLHYAKAISADYSDILEQKGANSESLDLKQRTPADYVGLQSEIIN